MILTYTLTLACKPKPWYVGALPLSPSSSLVICLVYIQGNTTMANGAMQPPGYLGQSMGPPSHQSPAMMGGDPSVMPGAPGAVRPPMGVAPPGSGSPAMSPAMQVPTLHPCCVGVRLCLFGALGSSVSVQLSVLRCCWWLWLMRS